MDIRLRRSRIRGRLDPGVVRTSSARDEDFSAGGPAHGLTRYLTGMLFGLTPHDPATFIAASLTVAAVATLASYAPARRATRPWADTRVRPYARSLSPRMSFASTVHRLHAVLAVEAAVAEIGAELRRARLARKQSIEDVSRATKINPSFVRAIENEDFAKLPGGLFTRGFLRAYAREVGLAPEEMVERYR